MRLSALALTPAARDWLSTTVTARVLNVFDRACNLINQDHGVLALVTSERGLTPFGMVVASADRTPFRVVSATSAVRVEAGRLIVGPLQINFASASLWTPIPDWPALRRMFAASPSRLDELSAMVAELAIAGSLLDLYLIPSTPSAVSGEGVRQQAMLDRARRGAMELVHGLITDSPEACIAGAKALAGLGGGLTPAGDDFMVGALLAAWAGLHGEGRESLGDEMVEVVASLTTTLSAAYLRAAARGECMAHWHRLFEALFRSDAEAIRAAIAALMTIGHTSGADALAGFLAVHHFVSPWVPSRSARRGSEEPALSLPKGSRRLTYEMLRSAQHDMRPTLEKR